jgi:hypothetical protein
VLALFHQGRKTVAGLLAHLDRPGLGGRTVIPDPVRIAPEAALWASVLDHRFLADAVIVCDDFGQSNVGRHAPCWVHAERLIHKLDTFSARQRRAVEDIRARVWKLYADLKAYLCTPLPRREGRHHVNRRFSSLPVAGTPRRVAVDGDHLGRSPGPRSNPGDEATLELLRIERREDVAEMVVGGGLSRKGRKRRNNSSFFVPNRAISVKVSAPASTASRQRSRISSSEYITLPACRGSGRLRKDSREKMP